MPKHPKGPELTEFQKGQIEGRPGSMSYADIGRELGIPQWTVSNFLDMRQSQENLPRPGRPRKTSKTTDRYIIRRALSETSEPLRELRNTSNADVSIQTIRPRLCEEGIRKWRAVDRAFLTEKTRGRATSMGENISTLGYRRLGKSNLVGGVYFQKS